MTILVPILAAGAVAASGSFGCSKGEDEAPKPPASASPVAVSTHNRLKFKGGERYATDLAEALAIPRGDLCKELSAYDCADVVHKIALGGIEPYRQTIYRPLPDRSVASANAVDRIALSGCESRAAKDFADGAKAVLFGELVLAGAAPGNDAQAAVAKRLYLRLMRREATAEEVTALGELYTDIASAAGAEAPRRFATLACFAVATTEEALFY